jgi:hypothetical protein
MANNIRLLVILRCASSRPRFCSGQHLATYKYLYLLHTVIFCWRGRVYLSQTTTCPTEICTHKTRTRLFLPTKYEVYSVVRTCTLLCTGTLQAHYRHPTQAHTVQVGSIWDLGLSAMMIHLFLLANQIPDISGLRVGKEILTKTWETLDAQCASPLVGHPSQHTHSRLFGPSINYCPTSFPAIQDVGSTPRMIWLSFGSVFCFLSFFFPFLFFWSHHPHR